MQTKDFPHVVILPAAVKHIRKEEMSALFFSMWSYETLPC